MIIASVPGKSLFRRCIFICTFLLCISLLPLEAMAMRCGNHLISKGDTQARVVKFCGEPVQAKQRFGLHSGVYLDRNLPSGTLTKDQLLFSHGRYINYGYREVVIEDWVFNLGPNKLMRQIIFSNGIVEKIDTLSYGYRE